MKAKKRGEEGEEEEKNKKEEEQSKCIEILKFCMDSCMEFVRILGFI